MTSTIQAMVIGAGPAGLAVSACLEKQGVDYVLVDRGARVGDSWRRHYDRLHLHTSRGFSGLPHMPMPSRYPRYPSRDQVVEYLEQYASNLAQSPRLGVEVEDLTATDSGWTVQTSEGVFEARCVVLATGANGEPHLPSWPGFDRFLGPVLHSSGYKSGVEFSGGEVLVVGCGNSGGEIALDLVEHGARPSLCVRGPVNVIPRDVLGVPILAIAIPLSVLPPRLADVLSWPLLKAHYPDYGAIGLRKANQGPFEQIAESGHIPLLDIGTTRAIRRGSIRVVPGIESFVGDRIRFTTGEERRFDAVVLATGYRPATPPGVAGGLRGPGQVRGSDPGLYYCGFFVSPTGMLREISREARTIGREIARELGTLGKA